MHEPFFFGPQDRQLFGSYFPPLGGTGRVMTVICPPLFTDLVRTYGALRRIAISAAESGQHVLRFDYRGTGDSYGELEDVTLDEWIDDIALAVQEGIDLSGCRLVRILGVRGSALLACKALEKIKEVDRLIFWDPVKDGDTYVRELYKTQKAMLERNVNLSVAEREKAIAECAAYSCSDALFDELGSIDSEFYSAVREGVMHVVQSSYSDAMTDTPEAMRVVVDYSCNWEALDDEIILPQPIVEQLIERVTAP